MTLLETAGAAAEASKAEAGAPAIAKAETASAKPKNADFAVLIRVLSLSSEILLGDLIIAKMRKMAISVQLNGQPHEPQSPPLSQAGPSLPPLAGAAMSESWRVRSPLSQDGQADASSEARTSFSNSFPHLLHS